MIFFVKIITVFATSAFIIFCLYVVNMFFRASSREHANPIDKGVFGAAQRLNLIPIKPEDELFWVPIIEKVVLSISDQQLLTGLAVLIAGFWTHCSISVHHFVMVSDLAWFSATAHLITLTVLMPYLKQPKHQVARNWRAALMASLASLLSASCIMQGHRDWYDSGSYDAQCVFNDLRGNISGAPRFWMIVNLILISISFPPAIIFLYERPSAFIILWIAEKPSQSLDKRIRMSKASRSNGGTAYIGRMGKALHLASLRLIQVAHRLLMVLISSDVLSSIFNFLWFLSGMVSIIEDRNIPSSEMAGSENVMSFGQIVPILLLSSTFFVFREAYDGQ